MDTIHLSASVVRASLGKGPARLLGLLGYIDGKRELGGVRVHSPHATSDVLARGAAGLAGYDEDRVAWVYALNAAELTKAGQYQMRGGKSVTLMDDTGRAIVRADGTPDVRRVGSKGPALARHVDVALPHGLDTEQRHALMQGMADWLRERFGCAVAWAAHSKGDGHLVVSDRAVRDDGSVGAKIRALNGPSDAGRSIEVIRAEWARRCNETGLVVWDHRSFLRRGLNYEPEKKVDRKAQKEAERRGVPGPFEQIRLNRPAVLEARARQDADRLAAQLAGAQPARTVSSSVNIDGSLPSTGEGIGDAARPWDFHAQDQLLPAPSETDRGSDPAQVARVSVDPATQPAAASDERRSRRQDRHDRSMERSARDREAKAKRRAYVQDRVDERARERADAEFKASWLKRQQQEQDALREREAAVRRRAVAEKVRVDAEAELARLREEVARRDRRDQAPKRAPGAVSSWFREARQPPGVGRTTGHSGLMEPAAQSLGRTDTPAGGSTPIRDPAPAAGAQGPSAAELNPGRGEQHELRPASPQTARPAQGPGSAPALAQSSATPPPAAGTPEPVERRHGTIAAARPDQIAGEAVAPEHQPDAAEWERIAAQADAEQAKVDLQRRAITSCFAAATRAVEEGVRAQRSRFEAVSGPLTELGDRLRGQVAADQRETARRQRAEQRRRAEPPVEEARTAPPREVSQPVARPLTAWNPLRDVLEHDRELVSYFVRALLRNAIAVKYIKSLEQALGTLADKVREWFDASFQRDGKAERQEILRWKKVFNEDTIRKALTERGVRLEKKVVRRRGGSDFGL